MLLAPLIFRVEGIKAFFNLKSDRSRVCSLTVHVRQVLRLHHDLRFRRTEINVELAHIAEPSIDSNELLLIPM